MAAGLRRQFYLDFISVKLIEYNARWGDPFCYAPDFPKPRHGRARPPTFNPEFSKQVGRLSSVRAVFSTFEEPAQLSSPG